MQSRSCTDAVAAISRLRVHLKTNGSSQNAQTLTTMVQHATLWLTSVKYKNSGTGCDISGPTKWVKTKFLATARSDRSIAAALGMNQSNASKYQLQVMLPRPDDASNSSTTLFIRSIKIPSSLSRKCGVNRAESLDTSALCD